MIDGDVDLVSTEFIGEASAVIEGSIALGGETGADVLQEVREQGIIGGVEGVEAEAGFDVQEGREHLLVRWL